VEASPQLGDFFLPGSCDREEQPEKIPIGRSRSTSATYSYPLICWLRERTVGCCWGSFSVLSQPAVYFIRS
jgi:hypothetical protein